MRDLDRQAKTLMARNSQHAERIGIVDRLRQFLRRRRAKGPS
ncbi:MAG: hypothetical protein OEU92_31455 [Alphaproteobacteria bacterium]|nr:hypothetical protein [Alphaproteobacteria bacterium]